MRSKLVVVSILLVTAIAAGCARFPAAPEHEVAYGGQIEVENGSFYMDGEFYIAKGTAPDVTFRDMQVVFYDDQRRVLQEIPIGDLSTDSEVAPFRREVNITSEQTPAYVILESPDFWVDNDTPTRAFRRSGDGYTRYYITDPAGKFDA